MHIRKNRTTLDQVNVFQYIEGEEKKDKEGSTNNR